MLFLSREEELQQAFMYFNSEGMLEGVNEAFKKIVGDNNFKPRDTIVSRHITELFDNGAQ